MGGVWGCGVVGVVFCCGGVGVGVGGVREKCERGVREKGATRRLMSVARE